VRVSDRERLEASACAGYARIRSQFEALFASPTASV
jgi:hypothetical protein